MGEPNSGESRRVLVLGDLCLDTLVAARLPLTWSSAAASGEVLMPVPITDQVGGTAYHFARGAAQVGLLPTVVGCVGQDAAGDLVAGALAAAGLDHRVRRSATTPTARTFVAFDVLGSRFMFTSPLNANDELPAELTRSLRACQWDLVWLSGVCLRSTAAPRFATVTEIAAHARAGGALVVLDVVPHDFHRLFGSLDEVAAATGGLDGVVSGLLSARLLLGLGPLGEGAPAERLAATAAALLEVFPFAVVQSHDGTTFHQTAMDRSGFERMYSRPVPQGSALVGYGDTLAGAAVRDYLGHRAEGTGGPVDDGRSASRTGEPG
jgi:sugar/nucleoside kinase (ribokinase family)